MTKKFKRFWIQNLKSGRYKKAKQALRNNNEEFCCLGVLCDLNEGVWKKEEYFYTYHLRSEEVIGLLPQTLRKRYGITVQQQTDLVSLNDHNQTWDKVIEYIEKSL